MNSEPSADTTDVPVTVWHNIATDDDGRAVAWTDGYRPGHPLVPVAHWQIPAGTPAQVVLRETFQLLNIGDDPAFGTPDPRAVRYRARRNRSLSIGDIIQIGETWNAVTRDGFTTVSAPEHFTLDFGHPGTTPLLEHIDHRGAPADHIDTPKVEAVRPDVSKPPEDLSTPRPRQRRLLSRLRSRFGRAGSRTGNAMKHPVDALTSGPDQAESLSTALNLIRAAVPNATIAHLSTSDQGFYGFRLADVEFPDGSLLSGRDGRLLDSLNEALFDHLTDLDWDGVVGEDEHGLAGLPLRVRPQAGDAVRLAGEWEWARHVIRAGDVGVIGGPLGVPLDMVVITFHARVYLTDRSVWCFGDPVSTFRPVTELNSTGETVQLSARRWSPGRSLADPLAEDVHQITVPLWNWTPPEDAG